MAPVQYQGCTQWMHYLSSWRRYSPALTINLMKLSENYGEIHAFGEQCGLSDVCRLMRHAEDGRGTVQGGCGKQTVRQR